MCPQRTPDALADALEAVLSNPDYARRIAAAARKYVVEHHPMSAMAEQTGTVFRQIRLQRQAIPLAKR
jgi:glycosyltransferase involved in cell wall biosynthesis